MPLARLNGHDMWFEVHGEGPPLVCSGGWGSFCHGGIGHVPRGLSDRYSVVVFDHRGIGRSTDDPSVPASIGLYADDVIALLDHLGTGATHLVGIVGVGACVFQEVAIRRPDLCRSLVNSGCWAGPDPYFDAQLRLWVEVHRGLGFAAFQRQVVLEAFDPAFFNERRDGLLGPTGPWSDLDGNLSAHERFTDANLTHDVRDRLSRIAAPALVFHQGRDRITPPRLSLPVEAGIPGAVGHTMAEAAHVITGREARAEFGSVILDFLGRH
jgi:3-oxoadipate enol-lactonase